jgi:exonuclease SbcD
MSDSGPGCAESDDTAPGGGLVVRVAAIGDAHLGRAYLSATTAGGVNQREHDFELSFEAAVELALVQSPDLVVWLGDVFDHPRPTYRSFRVAQRGLARIRDHGVPAVVISGNHDTPRLPGTGSPYSALADTFPEMHFAHRLAYERIELPGLVVHAVPQMLTVETTLEALDRADRERSLDRSNLLLTHPRLTQVEPRYADINEIELDVAALRSDFVLLGHYHVHTRVGERMWYAGSTDTFSFADDPERPKGVLLLDTDTGACRHLPLDGQRPLVTLETVHALGLSPTEVQALVIDRVQRVPDGAVARLFLDGVDPEAYRLLDGEAIREAARPALHLKLEPSFAGVAVPVELPELDSMPARWDRYVDDQDLTGFDRDRIRGLGREYLTRAVETAE